MLKLCELTGATSGALLMEDRLARTRTVLAQHGFSKISEISYRFGLAKYDYVFKAQVDQKAGVARQVVDHREIKHEHPLYYRLLMKPNNMAFISALNILVDEELHVGIGLHRGFDSDPFGQKELAILNLLHPHLARALRIQREFHRLRAREQSLRSTLSQLMLGVIVLGPDHDVLYANPVADAILRQHRGLEIGGGKLRAHYTEDCQRLTDMISTLSACDSRDVTTTSLALGLRHPERKFPLTVMLAKVDDAPVNLAPMRGAGGVALYISDPELPSTVPDEVLRSLYGITAAEAKVAVSLANGLSLQQISEQQGTELETVRSQLKSVFAKMGVRKQQDVIRILLAGALGIRQEQPDEPAADEQKTIFEWPDPALRPSPLHQ